MRVVIAGGSGFIGSHLCDRFLADGHEVVALDSFITGSPRNTAHLLDHARFSRIECDVARDAPVDGAVDAVLHFASPASPAEYLKHPFDTLRAGADATFVLAELAMRSKARFLLASTSEVYGDPLEHPQRETYWGHVNPIGPRSVYDEAKRFAESVTMAYHRELGLDTRIVRIFNTYGPRMQVQDGRSLPNFCAQALRGEPITIYGDGQQTRSFCYVSDLVEGICRLLASEEHGPVNLGNPLEITIRQLVDEILELTGSASEVQFHELPQDDPRQRQPDITRAKEILGWQPVVSRRAGLARAIEYFKAELAVV